jgi:two-component SAPR family response regulator
MAIILLNESDPLRHELLRMRLQRQGHKVWSAHHLNDIIATLHDVAVDLMILDLDHQRLDDLAAFADRWKGIKILFQTSSPALLQDFRCWMADQFVVKFHNSENLARAVAQLLQPKTMRRRNNYDSSKSYTYAHAAIA